jgi:hypothetical protein
MVSPVLYPCCFWQLGQIQSLYEWGHINRHCVSDEVRWGREVSLWGDVDDLPGECIFCLKIPAQAGMPGSVNSCWEFSSEIRSVVLKSRHLIPDFIYLFIYWDRVLLCSSDWPRAYYVVEAGFELMILLPQPPQCWKYRHAPSCPTLFQIIKTLLVILKMFGCQIWPAGY